MPSQRQQSSGNPAGGVDLLGMLSKERSDVALIFQTVVKAHLGRNGQDNPRDRQARIQKMIQDCVEKSAQQSRGEE
jgi:hypothetical protein